MSTVELESYRQFAAGRREARYYVAAAWIAGTPARGSNFRTDGRDLYSYKTRVGLTTQDGRKVALGCRYSQTTKQQTGPAQVMAAEVAPCEAHPHCRREVRA